MANAQTVQQRDKQITQWCFLRAGDVATVPESPTGQEDRQIAGGMDAGVARVAARQNRGLVQQSRSRFCFRLDLAEQAAKALHDFFLDFLSLCGLRCVLSVVRQAVVVACHARNLRHGKMIQTRDADDSS